MKKMRIMYTGNWPGFNAEEFFWTRKWHEWYDTELTDENPDVVITHGFSYDFLKYKCPRILISGECFLPDMNLVDYATSLCPLECEDRVIRWPYWLSYEDDVNAALKKNEYAKRDVISQRGFCSFVVSNGDGAIERKEIFDRLNSYKTVSSGGKFLNNVGGPVVDKRDFVSKYKFSIVCENARAKGYITEKLVQAFSAGTIPIYWGASDVTEEFNTDAFIDCNDKTMDEILGIVRELDNDDDRYMKMIEAPIFRNDSRGKLYYENDYDLMRRFWDKLFLDEQHNLRRNDTFYGRYYEREILKAYNNRRGIRERIADHIRSSKG